MRFSALLFDMDGLMIDTEAISSQSWHLAAAEVGHRMDEALIHAMVGLAMPRCHALLMETFGDATFVDTLHAASRRHYWRLLREGDIPLKPGIVELLEWASAQGIPRAVGTATQRELVNLKLTRTGLKRFFEHSVAGDEVANSKPAPDVYQEAARRLGQPTEACIVLEDSLIGMAAGLAAGARVVLVPDLVQPGDAERKQALAVCQSLHQVLPLLQQGWASR